MNHLSVKLNNSAAQPSRGPVEVRLYASTDNVVGPDDILLASVTKKVRLGVGKSSRLPLKFASPAVASDGDYFLLTKVDSPAGDSSTTATGAPVKINAAFSDLAVSFDGVPNQPIEIDGVSTGRRFVTVRLRNTGNVAATGDVQVNIYLSTDAVLDPTDPVLAGTSTQTIFVRAGKSRVADLSLSVPPGTAVGGYFLFAVFTPATFSDRDPANNVSMTTQRVAVVNRLPDPPRKPDQVTVYYDGPDFFYDGGDFGYYDYTDVYVPAPVYVLPDDGYYYYGSNMGPADPSGVSDDPSTDAFPINGGSGDVPSDGGSEIVPPSPSQPSDPVDDPGNIDPPVQDDGNIEDTSGDYSWSGESSLPGDSSSPGDGADVPGSYFVAW